ncbi:MAG: RDD family protein [Rubrivivax sp.]
MTPATGAAPLQAPGLLRRLACFTYEGVLLFAVLMFAGLLYGLLTQQRHALVGMRGLQGFAFLVLGIYFCWFWSHGGQTVAMKTWQIKLLTVDGKPVAPARAALRYALSWLWFLPALAWTYFAGVRSGGTVLLALAIGVASYAALAMLHPQRQYWHDLLSGTRLVRCQAPARRRG